MSESGKNPWPQSRVLVTGGSGFLGSALVWELNRQGCTDIVIADSAPREQRAHNLRALRFCEYLEPYAALAALLSGTAGRFDFVFHLGACSSTLETDTEYLRRNNSEFSMQMAGWALASGTRFVYASSAATYGDGGAGMEDGDPGQMERLRPLNAYADSKQRMDMEALRQGWLARIVGLKYFNVFGPNEGHKGEMRSMVLRSFEQAANGGSIRLFKSYRGEFADGEQKRDFLYVKDAVAMTLHLATNLAANGIFNIGSGQAHSWNELARAVFAALGHAPRIEYIEMPEQLRGKYQYFTQANIVKLRAAGYSRAITPFEDAVRDYVVNYLVPGKALGEEVAAATTK